MQRLIGLSSHLDTIPDRWNGSDCSHRRVLPSQQTRMPHWSRTLLIIIRNNLSAIFCALLLYWRLYCPGSVCNIGHAFETSYNENKQMLCFDIKFAYIACYFSSIKPNSLSYVHSTILKEVAPWLPVCCRECTQTCI